MRIRTKLAIAVVIAAVVLAGVVLVGLELFKDQTVDRVQSDVNETANRTAAQVNAVVTERQNTVIFYASRPQAASIDPNASRGYLQLFVNSTRFYAAQYIDANGTIVDYRGQITAQSRRNTLGNNVSDRPYVQSILQYGRGAYISDIEHAESIDRNLVIISAPVFDPQTNEIVGVLAGALRVREGDFFVATRPLETDTRTVQVNATTGNGSIAIKESNKEFNASIDATATVERTGWTVRVAQDRGPLNRQLRGLAIAQGIGIFLVVGVVAGLGFWEYSMNLRQTERLLDGFERLQAGDYDYELSLSAAEEWRQISDGYNKLSLGIKEREQAILEREQRLEVLNRVLRHNLQNDMSVILTYAEMLPTFEDQERIEDAASKIQEMGNGLISHGKKARQVETAMESAEEGTTLVEVVPLVEEIVADYRQEFDDVTFHTDLPEQAAADVISSFEYAIENLVENAAEHNDADDPFVSVAVEHVGDRIKVVVADNGPGIPSHEYEVLTQGEETALEHGSGVGLWLAYWVVEKSGGDLLFEDREGRRPTGSEPAGEDEGGAAVTIDVAAVETAPEPAEDSVEDADEPAEEPPAAAVDDTDDTGTDAEPATASEDEGDDTASDDGPMSGVAGEIMATGEDDVESDGDADTASAETTDGETADGSDADADTTAADGSDGETMSDGEPAESTGASDEQAGEDDTDEDGADGTMSSVAQDILDGPDEDDD